MYYLIYEIKNKLNNKIYIGFHKTKYLDDGYMGSGKHIKSALQKYGVDNFEKSIIKYCESEEEMRQLEVEIVNEEFIKRSDTYNLKVGGYGGFRKGYVSLHGRQISINEFKSNYLYHGVCKGKIAVFDYNGNTFQVNKDDKRLLTGELKRCFEKNGLISVINDNGERIRVTKDEFNTGNFTSIHKGLISVKDSNGKLFKVESNDNRYINGELVGMTKGENFNESQYHIFDDEDNLKYDIKNENFIVFCKKNNLPYSALIKSYNTNGGKLYQNLGSNKKRLESSGLIKYRNWYCLKIK